MAVSEELLTNVLPQELVEKITFLLNILQIVGVAIILYLLFNIVNIFLSKKKERELKKISDNLEIIKQNLLSRPI